MKCLKDSVLGRQTPNQSWQTKQSSSSDYCVYNNVKKKVNDYDKDFDYEESFSSPL